MTERVARRIVRGSTWTGALAIVAIAGLAYVKSIDGATAIVAILGITGTTGGTNAAVQAHAAPSVVAGDYRRQEV